MRSNTSTHCASPSGTSCSSASLPHLDVELHPFLLLPTLERWRAQMELLSLTRRFFHLSYSNTGEESCLIPGPVSPETESDYRISAWCQRAPQQSLKGFQVVFLWYYDFFSHLYQTSLLSISKGQGLHTKAGVNSDSFRMNLQYIWHARRTASSLLG